MKDKLNQIPWSLVLIACLSLGLAPFDPPHIWEKLVMLGQGKLTKPIDIGDLLFHGIPWFLLIIKGFFKFRELR